MAENHSSRVSSLAFIDAIIADMEQKITSKTAHPQFDMQMIFIRRLRAQLEQNCRATDNDDFSAELNELRQLQTEQLVLIQQEQLADISAQEMLSFFR
jgi:hypothetical protein